ncbi:hypothetical protein O6H91_11G058400 [Diphasiastrum complanatum]|uniref:Uncharacterized protein n=1 Tax=Diphasiastrum complanatum TaxID=34168 RepID=A0ACC2C9P8_DIPCM|nr:hypothetical protein O6H91_11G058400 [Diphasiastrum complanatum]
MKNLSVISEDGNRDVENIVQAATGVDVHDPFTAPESASQNISQFVEAADQSQASEGSSKSLMDTASARVKRLFSHQIRNPAIKHDVPLSDQMPTANTQNRLTELVHSVTPKLRKLRRSTTAAAHGLKGLRFIAHKTGNADPRKQWEAVESQFQKRASADGRLARADFGACIGMKETEFAGALFDALACKGGTKVESISKEDLHEFWLQMTNQDFDLRMRLFFQMCDKNGDGRISQEEVKEIILLSASANKLSAVKEQADEYAALVMEELDPNELGYIELWQLEMLMKVPAADNAKDPLLHYKQTLISHKRKHLFQSFTHWCTLYSWKENWRRFWVISLWVAAMAGLFTWKFLEYRHNPGFKVMGYCLCTAKGAAETLKLNMAMILLPVCRNTITWLRSTTVGYIVPFNDNITFHMTIAGAIAIGVIVHGGTHLACDFPRIEESSYYKFMTTIGKDFDNSKPSYGDLLLSVEGATGIAMVILMTIIFVLATHWFRRNIVKLPWPLYMVTGYNSFWYSHHLLVLVYAMLIIHSMFLYLSHKWTQKTTWMYLAVPMLLYGSERILRIFRSNQYEVQTLKAGIHKGDVLALQMQKPAGFQYKSGMYLFLKCPSVARFEWHPFSITSAPSDDYLSVHIRTLGDWTREMRKVFSEVCQKVTDSKSGLLKAECAFKEGMQKSRFPALHIDGPYGAPAQDYKKYDVLLLVGLGIGATPFISILKDMLNHVRKAEEEESLSADMDSRADVENLEKGKHHFVGPRNAYFYWVTPEQGSFEWFEGVMNEIAEIDQEGVIEMHNHLTSVYEQGDARSALIAMLQALYHAKNGVDVLSRTKVRTHFARPDWRKVFAQLAAAYRNARIGVFYCGPVVLAKELDALSQEFTSVRATQFDFHKENF